MLVKTRSPGSASQIRLGAKSFVIPGIEVSLAYAIDNQTKEPLDGEEINADTTHLQAMLHTYF